MALVQHHRGAGHHFARRAWVATALIPVGFAVATAVAFAGGEHGENANHLAGAAVAVVALAAPAAASTLALLAKQAGEPRAGAAFTVSVLLGLLVLLLLPVAVVSGESVLIAAAVYVVGIAAAGLFRGRMVPK